MQSILYVAATKCYQNRFIPEKYKKKPSFKPHFHPNSRYVQLHNSANDCKGDGNIPGRHFVKTFSARPSHS